MFQTKLRYGIQEAAVRPLEGDEISTTVGQQIEKMLEKSDDPRLCTQIQRALEDPQSTIEIRSGKRVQTATPGMPMRELLGADSGELEITVSQPHVGG